MALDPKAAVVKVSVSYTVEATDDVRRAINHHYGRPGLATRQQVKDWYESYGLSGDDDLMWDLNQAEINADEISQRIPGGAS